MEHIQKNWLSFSNKDFQTALLQIVGALVALHRYNKQPSIVVIVVIVTITIMIIIKLMNNIFFN